MRRWWETPEFVVERDGEKHYEVHARDVFKRTGEWPVTEKAMRRAMELDG